MRYGRFRLSFSPLRTFLGLANLETNVGAGVFAFREVEVAFLVFEHILGCGQFGGQCGSWKLCRWECGVGIERRRGEEGGRGGRVREVAMPSQSSTPTKKAPGAGVSHVGTPTPSLQGRRGVKPLGENNRSRSHSPALGSLSVKEKRTPARAQQKTMLTGVDLTRRFADSLTTNRGTAAFGSPRGSPTLDRIQEGCSSSLGRERKGVGTAFKSRLRGGDDTPPVKKAITFSTPFGKEKSSFRKQDKLLKRKDLSEHFVPDVEDKALSSLAPPLSTIKPFVERHGGRDVDFLSKEPILLEVQSKLSLFSDLPMSKSIGLRGKLVGSDCKVTLTETLAPRSSTHDKLAMGIGHRSFGAREGRSFVEDAPCRLAFDAIELSPQGPKSVGAQSSGVEAWKDERLGAAASVSPQHDDGDADVMPSPLQCKSPEVCNRGVDEAGLPWEYQEDTVAQEWFHSRDMSCFESFSKGSKTPEPQPSKSPELSRRAIGLPGVGALLEGTGVDRQGDVANQNTPSPQPTSSPEFLKRGSVPPSTGGCFGAGPLMGPEGMRSVKDRRKCKPRGILTIEGELIFTSGSADALVEEVQVKETISAPALASVEWMVAEGYDVVPLEPPGSSPNRDMRDIDASPKLTSPGSLTNLRDRDSTAPGHRRCRSAVESGSDQVFWKKGLLYEWNLSLSDQKRAEIPSPSIEEEASASPVGKLCDFSPETTATPSRFSNIMGSSLVMGALGSLTNTPSSCRDASDLAGEDDVESKYISSDIKIDHRNDEDLGRVQELLLVEKTLQELSLDGQAPRLSMSFSLDSSPDSGGSWRGIHTSQSTAWGDSQGDDSQGEWGDYLRNNRYKGFNSQFRFPSSREEYTPAAKADTYTRALSRELSPSTLSGGYSDEGDSVVCTPSSTVAHNFENSPQMQSPYQDTWKKYGTVGKSAKGVGMGIKESPETVSRDASPDLVGISISMSDAPSLDSSSDDFEMLRFHHHSQVHPTLVERDEETKAARGRLLLQEADYSPSSLLKADAFRASVSIQPLGR